MTSSTQEAQLLIKSFLQTISYFRELDVEVIEAIVQQLQPVRFSAGQVLLEGRQLPSHLCIIYEGQIQLLGKDPTTQHHTALDLLNPRSVVGWLSLVRLVPCEIAIAAGSGIALAWSTADFFATLKRIPQLDATFKNESHIIEAYELLSKTLGHPQDPSAQPLKQLARETYTKVRVKYLKPGRYKTAVLDPAWRWVISGGAPTNWSVGSVIRITDDEQAEKLQVVGPRAARLIGFPLDVIANCPDSISDTSESSQSLASLPNPLDSIAADPSLSDPEFDSTKTLSDPGSPKSFPVIRAKRPIKSELACFQMLSQYFAVPFRRDTIRRILSDRLSKQQPITLELCGGLVELLGLRARLLKVAEQSFRKLEFPGLCFWQDQLVVIYAVTGQEVSLGIPQQGLKRIPVQKFLAEWPDPHHLLLVTKALDSPQHRFGLSWFVPSLIKYAPTLTTVLVASFFVQMFGLANPLIVQVIIDKVLSQNSPDTLNVLGILLLGIALAEAVLGSLRTYTMVDTTNRIDLALGSDIINHLFRLPLRYFERRPVGELASRINELETIRKFLTGTALTVILDIIFSVIYLAVMLIYSGLLTAIALAVVPIFAALTLILSPIMRRQLRAKAERNSQTQSYLVEVLSGIQTVKAQNIELKSKWRWQDYYGSYISAGFQTVLTSTISGSMSSTLNKVSNLMLLWVGSYLVLEGKLTLGQLIAFRIIAGYATNPLLRLVQLWQSFQEMFLSLERLSDILDTPIESDLSDQDQIPMPPIVGKVIYDNVSFRFKEGGPLQLKEVSQIFPPGSFVGLIGQSASRKSKFMKVLPRLYIPESGRILVDGYDISKVELYSLRHQIGMVLQDPLLFEGTVQENLTLSNPDASADEVIEAAKIAVAHDFIMALSNGYATRLGEKGSGLSGGQRQRLAIARMILQKPSLVILDEATSALDYDTERRVYLNLTEHFRGRTIFFITHRLSTIRHADLIVVMDKGSIVERGSHEELLVAKGRYFELYQSQRTGF